MNARLLVAFGLLAALATVVPAEEKKGPTAQYEFEKTVVPLPRGEGRCTVEKGSGVDSSQISKSQGTGGHVR